MNYLLDINKGLLVTSNDSNQHWIFPYFHFTPFIFYCVYFLYSGFCFISLLYLNPMGLVCAFSLLLSQSIAADCVLFSLNDSFLLCKERL
ncbi:TPA: hypothetical protein ACWM1T_001763 [Legionella pneumophila]|nr:hypothetical protein [Legionella pneumophila]HAT7956535.1 hypothetical protein [Legionella pneumophila]HAU1384807.1 hypothetical protein [Legionella pneumophila]HAU2065960.1 hypothetical protein [Legionella pneumophila]HBD9439182.1 hypothetical protein [Legionella pneumophila]